MAVKRMDTGACPICGRALSRFTTHVTLKDDTKICRDCENKLRVKSPLSYYIRSRGTKRYRKDPLQELTLMEFLAELEGVKEYVEDLREKYGFNAVYQVEDITMEPNGWFDPPLIFAKGRVVYGFFDIGDKVRVVRRGVGVDAEIKGINRQFGEEQDIIDWEHRGEPGYPCDSIVFSQKDLIVAPGDIIVK